MSAMRKQKPAITPPALTEREAAIVHAIMREHFGAPAEDAADVASEIAFGVAVGAGGIK